MKWTTKLPDRTGWWWLRHVIGSIPSDEPIHAIIMRHPVKRRGKWVDKYDKRPSVYYRGQWRDVTEVPSGYRWRWSDRPIRLPKGEAPNSEIRQAGPETHDKQQQRNPALPASNG